MTTTDSGGTAREGRTRSGAVFWLRTTGSPVVVLALLTTLLAFMYLDYVIDPQKNLHHFPIALVNQDVGDTLGEDGQRVNFGDQVAAGMRQSVPADQIELRELGIAEAEQQMRAAKVYATIIIPSDFTKRLGILGAAGVVPGEVELPIITLQTNPRTGAYATAIVNQFGDQLFAQVDAQVGEQLLQQVKARLTPPPGAPATELSGAATLTLESPVRVVQDQFRPLPSGTGQGLAAFFYALLILLIGVVGSMTVHTMVDAGLGFVPTEYGPWYVHYPPTPISRLRTLAIKWGVMAVVAALVSGIFMAVAHSLDMPIERPLALYLYGAFALLAVGVTGLSILASLGSAGLLVNLILFVVLGLPSSGGTVPIEATPRYFGWLAEFEPMHQVFLGIRSILYFEARLDAGLSRAVWMTTLGLAIGLILGAVVSAFYDRKGLHRGARTPARAPGASADDSR